MLYVRFDTSYLPKKIKINVSRRSPGIYWSESTACLSEEGETRATGAPGSKHTRRCRSRVRVACWVLPTATRHVTAARSERIVFEGKGNRRTR